MFQRLLPEEAIGVHLEAPNREAAIAEMIALLPSWALGPRQKAELLELLLQRERFGTTAIGDGVALPHCTLAGLEAPLASLGISRKGILYPSLDGAPVHIVCLVIFPEKMNDASERTRVLHDAELLFRDRFLKERLKISETPEEAYEILMRESAHVFESLRLAGRR